MRYNELGVELQDIGHRLGEYTEAYQQKRIGVGRGKPAHPNTTLLRHIHPLISYSFYLFETFVYIKINKNQCWYRQLRPSMLPVSVLFVFVGTLAGSTTFVEQRMYTA